MPPKFDPNAVYEVILRVTGGEGAATAALAPKIGPLGLVSLSKNKLSGYFLYNFMI
jgi:large subunit ribosomal protein L12e